MGRKPLMKNSSEIFRKFRSSDEIESILTQQSNMSDFIRIAISKYFLKESELDTEILRKMIPVFVDAGIELDLEQEEISRIQELYEEVKP